MKMLIFFIIFLLFSINCPKREKERKEKPNIIEKQENAKLSLKKKESEKKVIAPMEKKILLEPQKSKEPNETLLGEEKIKKPFCFIETQLQSPIPDPRLLLILDDVYRMNEKKGSFEKKELVGIEPSENYKSLYFSPKENKKNFGVSIQIWFEKDLAKLKEKYQLFFKTYPNAVEIHPIGEKAFFAYWGNIIYLSFLDMKRNLIITLSCGRNICDSDEIYELGKKVAMRVK